ncbi:MAG: 3-dehydroquinate synthase [Wolinella sp.]
MKRVMIELGAQSYPIYFGALKALSHEGKVLIVTNPKVGGLYLSYLLSKLCASEVYICTIPDGEVYKNLANIELILEAAFTHRLDRKSLMIALGGGVVGDMVGFAAGIFQRGIGFVQIPTTLLAQVDASVGGKTGVNNAFGKNLIGLFHQPRSVHIDPAFLDTLPSREFGAGIAEIVKMAVTFDSKLFNELEANDLRDRAFLLHVCEECVKIKARVVIEDEKERGIRAALNYGHTFAHVIEHESGYGHYLHGEAVSMGIVMANALACRLGILQEVEAERIESLLARYELPTRYKITDCERFYELFFLDKKSENSRIKFILPRGIGAVEFRDNIAKSEVLSVLEQFCD